MSTKRVPYVNGPTALVIVAIVLVGVFGAYVIDDWNTREDYIDRCIIHNYTEANGFPPGLKSFCIAAWRQKS